MIDLLGMIVQLKSCMKLLVNFKENINLTREAKPKIN